jgi:hypothetical protein
MRRNISGLSREMGVSRTAVYKAMERIGVYKNEDSDFEPEEWDRLVNEITVINS